MVGDAPRRDRAGTGEAVTAAGSGPMGMPSYAAGRTWLPATTPTSAAELSWRDVAEDIGRMIVDILEDEPGLTSLDAHAAASAAEHAVLRSLCDVADDTKGDQS